MNVKFEIAIFLGRLIVISLLTVSTGIYEFYIRIEGPGICWKPWVISPLKPGSRTHQLETEATKCYIPLGWGWLQFPHQDWGHCEQCGCGECVKSGGSGWGSWGAARGEKMGVRRGINKTPALPSFLIWSLNSNGAKKGKGQRIEVTRVVFVDVGRMNPSLAIFGGVVYHPLLFWPGISHA